MPGKLSTLCYIERDGQYLMLHRVVKKNDVNKDKWIGVGGHFEEEESPEECLLREVWEETGYTLTDYRFRGIVTFVSGDGVTEYMHLFTATDFTGTPIPCNEGVLEWVPIEKVWDLNLWEGDKIFFRLLDENVPFFSLKLTYNGHGILQEAILNGKPLELFEIVDQGGKSTGIVRERGVAHCCGSPHKTVHTWLARKTADGGCQLLLQKRSKEKDAWPGCYDISSAGHISVGEEPLTTALRELQEELGITVNANQLLFLGNCLRERKAIFHGRPFHDCEYSTVFLCFLSPEQETFSLQPEEVEDVLWVDVNDFRQLLQNPDLPHCIDDENELSMLLSALNASTQSGENTSAS